MLLTRRKLQYSQSTRIVCPLYKYSLQLLYACSFLLKQSILYPWCVQVLHFLGNEKEHLAHVPNWLFHLQYFGDVRCLGLNCKTFDSFYPMKNSTLSPKPSVWKWNHKYIAVTSYHSATSCSWSLSSVRRNELEHSIHNSKVEVAWTFFLSPKVCVIAVRIHKQASYFVTELVLYLLKKTRDEKKILLATSQHLLDGRGWAYNA